MKNVNKIFGLEELKEVPLRDFFLGWQCRCRQMIMREQRGRPSDAIMPIVTLKDETEAFGSIITVLNRKPHAALLPEMQHMIRRTADPAQRRDKAVQLFSSTYFQNPQQFSDILTSQFLPYSAGAQKMRAAEYCWLDFSAYNQKFKLYCRVWHLDEKNPLYSVTWWHNHLFNPNLSEECIILGFEPVWDKSSATPMS